jgi:hypothetical protein
MQIKNFCHPDETTLRSYFPRFRASVGAARNRRLNRQPFGDHLHRDPPRLVFGEQFGCGSSPWLIRERQSVVVADNKTGVGFLDGPRRREAAERHCGSAAAKKPCERGYAFQVGRIIGPTTPRGPCET